MNLLLEKASIQGYLTTDDLVDFFPDTNLDTGQMRVILSSLRNQGVEVFEPDLDTGDLGDEIEELEPNPYINPDEDQTGPEDTIGLYLKEMSHVPLLKVDEERDLAIRIEAGRNARHELSCLPDLRRRGERIRLETRVQDGIAARDHLIRANTRLVISIAKHYMGHAIPFLDLIQEGNLGLMKAVEKFDVHRGFRFSTYATWWIRQSITRAIADQSRTIRVPVHMADRIRQLYRFSHDLEQNLGRAPTEAELAEKMGLPVKKVDWIRKVSWLPLSLDTPINDDEDSELGLFIEDRVSPSPQQSTQDDMLSEKIEELLGTLSPREARVLRLRFGLNHEIPCTLEEVGAKFGLTRERIRQIEGKALRRLRHPRRARQLKDYL